MSKFSGKMCSCALHCSDIKKYEQNFSILKIVVLPGNPNLIKYSVCFYLAFLFCFNCACVFMCVLFITYNLDLDNNILHLMP